MDKQLNLSYRQITAELDNCTTSEEALAILQQEVAGANRPAFTSRIYGRYDTMRRAQDRMDLAQSTVGTPAGWLCLPGARSARPVAGNARTAAPVQAPGKGAASGAPVRAAGKGAAGRTGRS